MKEVNTHYKTYIDLTILTKLNKSKKRVPKRRLDFSVDSDGVEYNDFYFEKDNKLLYEIKYQKILEKYLNEEVYLNPKAKGVEMKKFPDYYIKKKQISWELKTLNGKSDEIINNVLSKVCKKKQSSNIVMRIGNCPHNNLFLKNKLVEIFEKGKRPYIKEVMLFSKRDVLLLHLQR